MEIKTPSVDQIRTRLLSTIQNSLISKGISEPNVGFGSDYYIRAQSMAEQIQLSNDLSMQKFNSLQSETATSTDLEYLANSKGLYRKEPAQATGYITVSLSSSSVLIPALTELSSPDNGSVYTVFTDTTVTAANPYVKVVSKNVGSNANIAAGFYLTFSRPPTYIATKALIYTDIAGGSDIESDASLQSRLIQLEQNPPTSGNVGDIIRVAMDSHPLIKDVYVYPCINGPASANVCVMQDYNTLTDKTRDIADVNVLNLVQSNLANTMPPYAEYFVFTAQPDNVDVSVYMSFENNQFVDDLPFPTIFPSVSPYLSELNSSTITAISTDKLQITFSSTRNAFGYRNKINIGYITSTYEYKQVEATLISATFQSSPYTAWLITANLSIPMNVEVDQYIFPALKDGQLYVNTMVEYISKLAPGQKTTNVYMTRAKRQPANIKSTIDNSLGKYFTNAYSNVTDVDIVEPSIPYEAAVDADIYTKPYYIKLAGLSINSHDYDFKY